MVISQTPLRVSFFGGGTDIPDYYELHGGAVISCTIDKYIYVIVKARYDKKIVLNYSKKEIVDDVDDVEHNIIRESLKYVGIQHGIEITSIGDIPSQGSGLGSSSSFTVGLLNALYAFQGRAKNAKELAEIACKIEIEILGEPIGKQDQYAAAFGGFQKYEFLQNNSVEVVPLNVSDSSLLLLQRSCAMFYTGITRRASSVLSDVREKFGQNDEVLSSLKKMVFGNEFLFENGDIKGIGEMLHEAWQVKKKMSTKVSNILIDSIYEKAMTAGAYGGKLLGAGGGGFFLFLIPSGRTETFRESFCDLIELPFSFTRTGTKILLNVEERVYSLC